MGQHNEAVGVADGVARSFLRRLCEHQGPVTGKIFVTNERTGETFQLGGPEGHNLFVTVGKNQTAKRFCGVTANAFSYIALGTSDTAADPSDTALGAEITTNGGGRAQDASTETASNVAKIDVTFNFSGDLGIKEIGLFDAASTGNMAARQVFAVLNVKDGDIFTFRWEITFG